ncbi:MAG: class I SAM-dependent methyltransferase [Promethearchaeota archaeon]
MNIDKIQKVHLTEEKLTLLITLYAKAFDSQSKNSILKDTKANEIIETIDYDFTDMSKFGNGNIIVVRAKQFDDWVKEFLENHSNVIVLNLGCGLDTRIERINPSPNVNWYDVDYPEVIQLRKHFFSDKEGYHMIAASIIDSKLINNFPSEGDVLVIADGVFEYLTKGDVQILLNQITNHFSHGQIMFDAINSFAIESAKSDLKKKMSAEHKWAVEDLHEVDTLNPKLKRISNMTIWQSKYINKLPFKYRLVYRGMSVNSKFKNMIRLLRYDF